MSSVKNIVCNGEARETKSETVAEFLTELQLGGTKVAVERNKTIVSREKYEATPILDDDVLEIVHFVGGG